MEAAMTTGPRRHAGPDSSTWVDWDPSDHAVEALLEALVTEVVKEEVVELERDAGARRSTTDLANEERKLARQERNEAHHDRRLFRAALRDAAAAPAGAVYDSADPDRDALADVLIRYLVRTGYAEVETETPEPGHHRYTIQVDWTRLHALEDRISARRKD
jgi:hypothetical protein